MSWSLFVILISAVYAGTLTGYFAIRIPRLPFYDLNSLADELLSGNFRIVTETLGDSFFTEVRHSNVSTFKKINEAINKFPPKLMKSSDDAIEFISKNFGFVFISTENRLKLLTAQLNCTDFSIIVDRQNLAKWQGLGFPKGSKHVEAFTGLIAHLKDLIDFITDHYERALQACPVQEKIHLQLEHQSLTFAHIAGVCYVCSAIVGFAIVFLFIEIFCKKNPVRLSM